MQSAPKIQQKKNGGRNGFTLFYVTDRQNSFVTSFQLKCKNVKIISGFNAEL